MITEERAEEYLTLVDSAAPEERQRMLGELREFRAAQIQEEQRQRDAYTRDLYRDVDTLGGHWLPEMQKALSPFMQDPKADRAAWANTRYLANAAGISVEQAAGSYEVLRNKYAQEHFRGEPKDDLSFYAAVAAQYDQKDAEEEAQQAMMEDAIAKGLEDWRRGHAPMWSGHLGKLKGVDGTRLDALRSVDPEAMDVAYGGDYMRAYNLMFGNPEAGLIINSLAHHMGRTDLAQSGAYSEDKAEGLRGAATTLAAMPQEAREELLAILPLWLKANGEADPQGFLSSAAEMFRQMGDAMGRGADSGFGSGRRMAHGDRLNEKIIRDLQEGREVRLEPGKLSLARVVTPDTMMEEAGGSLGSDTYSRLFVQMGHRENRAATPEEREELLEQALRRRELYQAERWVDAAAKQQFKPLRNVTPLGAAERGLYMAAESVPLMAAGTLPRTGLVLMMDAMRTQEYNRLRLQYPEMSAEEADTIATVSAVPMAALERLQLKGIMGGGSLLAKVPALEKAIKQMGAPSSRFWRQFAGRVTAGTAEQMVQEAAQEAIPGMVFNALTEDYPKVDWAAAFGETLTSPEVFFATLPFVLVGSGIGSWTESRDVARALPDPRALQMLGIPQEKAQAISAEAKAGRMNEAEVAFREAWAERTKEDIERGAEAQKREIYRTRDFQNNPEIPMPRLNGSQWEMVEPDGSVSAAFESEDAAMSQWESRMAWEKSGQAQEVRELVQWFAGRVDPERTVEITGRTKTVEEGMAESALNAEALAERMRIAAIEEGADPASLIIKGETVEQLREGVYRDVIRLYNGADVMDVVEEHAHAQLNLDLREGRISREEAADAAVQWAEETGFALEDASNPTEVEIHEALADMAKAHFLNERKSLPDLPNSVRAFIAKMRVYLREILGRAKALIEMREAGKLSESVEGYLARTLGMNEQLELNRATAEAVGAGLTSYSLGERGQMESVAIAIDKIAKGADEVPNAFRREELSEYGGATGVTLKWGDAKKGLVHIGERRGTETVLRVLEAAALGEVSKFVPAKKTVHIERNGYEAVLSLDEHGQQKTWLLTGWKIEMPGAKGEVSAHPEATQNGPTFSRAELGAGISKLIESADDGKLSYSIGRADYLSEVAASLDARRGSETGLAFAEKVQANLERGARSHELLERMVRLEEQQDARTVQLREDIVNLELRLEEQLEILEQQKAEQIAKAGTDSMAKFMDRIEAAKTERERTLLRREARETAADLKRGIEKDFKAQEKALRERMRGEATVLRERAMGSEKAAKAKADAADQRAALIQALVDYNAILMALPPEVRGKLGGFVVLAKLRTDRARAKFFRERFPKVQEAFEKHLRAEYDAVMKKLIVRAKPKRDKAGKKPVGKLGADLHALFKTLEDAMRWTAAEVAEHIAKLEGRLAEGELSPEAEARAQMEIGLVNLLGDWESADSARKGAAVANVKEVLHKGYNDYLLQKLEEREARKRTRQQLIADTGKSGKAAERDARLEKDAGLFGSLRAMKFELSSFEQLLGYCFGSKSADAQRLADLQRVADNNRVDAEHMVSDGINALFTELGGSVYKGAEVHWRLSQKSMKVQGRSLSELEAITATLMWRQEDGRRHMEGIRDEDGTVTSSWSYDQKFIDEIEAKLSPEAVAVRDYIAREYGAEWDEISPLFRELNGVDLPRHANYAPLTVKPMQAGVGEVVDPVTGVAVNAASTTPGSFRTRGRLTAEPDFKDAVKVFVAHKSQINHWKAYAKFALEARSVLGNREVMNAVEARAGKSAVDALSGWLDYLIQGGNRDAAMRLEVNGMLSRMLSRAASMAIVGRVGVLAVQSTQLGAALAEMPTASYLKRMGQLFTGQLGWGDAIASPYIQRRMIEMPPLVRQALEGLRAEKPSRVKHVVQMLGRTIAGADALFTAGTYAMVYDFKLTKLKEQGVSEADAVKLATVEAERVTDRLAQPVRPGARSLYEVRTTGNPATRLLWAFASEARKNVGLAMYAMSNRTMAEKARTLAYVAVINPLVASLIRAAWRDARDSEDDDIFDEKHWNAKRMALAVATEPLAGIPVVGEMAQELIYKGLGVYVPSGNLLSSGANAVPAIKRLPETLAGEQDASQVLRDAESILTGMGLFNANFAAAASLSHIVRDLFGVAENAKEQIEE